MLTISQSLRRDAAHRRATRGPRRWIFVVTFACMGTSSLMAGPTTGSKGDAWGPAQAEQLFALTERYLRPAATDELLILAHELESRGLDSAARDVRARVNDAELARELLRLGQPSAALALISTWRAHDPDNPRVGLAEAIAHYAEGSVELAERSLRGGSDRLTSPEKDLARTLLELALFQSTRRSPASAEANPWGVEFVGPTGEFEAGKLAEEQAAKLPPGTLQGTALLVDWLPTSAPTWALLAELLNAEGHVDHALTAFARARALGYTPRWLVTHANILADDRQRRQMGASSQIPAAESPAQAAPDSEAEPGWSGLWTRPRDLIVVVVGAGLAILLLALQIRTWFRSVRSHSSTRKSP